MSEQGWRAFLAADGVEDWVVLHGGAIASFRVGSMGEAARLAEAISAVPGDIRPPQTPNRPYPWPCGPCARFPPPFHHGPT